MICLKVLLLLMVTNVCFGQQPDGDKTNGFMDLRYLSTKLNTALETTSNVATLQEQLRIVDSMRFSCSGEIIGFYLGATVKSVHQTIGTYPRAIIFRRRSDDRRRRSGSEDGIYYTHHGSVELRPTFTELDTTSGGMYRYLIPSSSDPLYFSSGDVFGVYQPPPSNSEVILHYTNSSQSFETTSYVRTASDTSNRISQNSLHQVQNEYLLMHPIVTSAGSSCLPQFLDLNSLRALSPLIGDLTLPINSELRLFPDINFNSDTYITSWTVGGMLVGTTGVTSSSSTNSETEFQIWSKGENSFMVSAVYGLNMPPVETNQKNLYEFKVNPPIQVKAGDILGVFQPSNSIFKVYYQENNGPRNVMIGLQESSQLPSQLELAVITASSDVNDYPLITVNVTDQVDHMTKSHSIDSTSMLLQSSFPTTTTNVQVTSTQPSISVGHSNTLASSSITTPTSIQQQPSLAAAVSDDPILIAIISIGTVIIVLTIPALVVTVLVAVYLHRKSSDCEKKAVEVHNAPSSYPDDVPASNSASLASNTSSSSSSTEVISSTPTEIISSTPNNIQITNSGMSVSDNITPSSSYDVPPSSERMLDADKKTTTTNDSESRDSMQMNPLYYYNVRRMKSNVPPPPAADPKYINVTKEPIYEEI